MLSTLGGYAKTGKRKSAAGAEGGSANTSAPAGPLTDEGVEQLSGDPGQGHQRLP